MERELVEEIGAFGLSEAYFRFTVLVDEEPLNPRGWLGLALVAEASGDTQRGGAYRQRAAVLNGKPAQVEPVSDDQDEAEFNYLRNLAANPNVAKGTTTVFTAPSVTQDRGFVPVSVPNDRNLRPLIPILCLMVPVCSCLLWISCNKNPASVIPAPTTIIASQRSGLGVGNLKGSGASTQAAASPSLPLPPGWREDHLQEVGNLRIIDPPTSWPSTDHPDAKGDHYLFSRANTFQVPITVDVAPTGPPINATTKAVAFDKSYKSKFGSRYHRTELKQIGQAVFLQYDVKDKFATYRKREAFLTLPPGRFTHVVVSWQPDSEYATFTDGIDAFLSCFTNPVSDGRK